MFSREKYADYRLIAESSIKQKVTLQGDLGGFFLMFATETKTHE
jgi:hypothetical protein